MNLSQIVVGSLIGLFLLANLLHPGGWALTLLIITVLVVFYALLEFVPEYILVTNQGKNARKQNRRKRRARGLNPFSRTSKRDGNGGQSRDTTNQSNSSGGENQ
ncbi:hypothetical protein CHINAEXTREME_20505 (plasmid) [Halobiforma lacisalsi AJ5]|uniref:Uncharacterized protein n=1 Tax=Natronobacterium lacisalsi AJ5 TaxID=358396 RepID=M0LUZ1_NATLA|nr:hypothetical protein [Halobiforma lacisalsi]APX00196.1 hypothetical protein CHINAEXTREME_20505 [Halobiforma lacisalsi AJ5]EMA37387.1 hypothetical protein C445_00821 [Halobiforma lacisalsi AJ5]